jgi:hypothetical protein
MSTFDVRWDQLRVTYFPPSDQLWVINFGISGASEIVHTEQASIRACLQIPWTFSSPLPLNSGSDFRGPLLCVDGGYEAQA